MSAGTTTLSVQDMYSRWKEWVAQDDNAKFLPFLTVVGGDTTVGNNAIASYFFVQNGWRIRPQESNHTLTVNGILVSSDGSDVFTDTIGTYRVRIVQVIPLQAETITVQGGTGTSGPSADQVATAVWNHPWALTVARFLGFKT